MWPVPDQGTALQPYYIFKYWRMRRIDDAGAGIETQDVNFRFYPAMAAGLAYHIAMKTPELMERVPMQIKKHQACSIAMNPAPCV